MHVSELIFPGVEFFIGTEDTLEILKSCTRKTKETYPFFSKQKRQNEVERKKQPAIIQLISLKKMATTKLVPLRNHPAIITFKFTFADGKRKPLNSRSCSYDAYQSKPAITFKNKT